MLPYALCLMLFGISAFAQDWARERLDKSSRHQEWVYLKHSGPTVDAFVVYPEVSQKTPVILVIHENQGLTEWVESVADALAEAGYIAIAPDLLSGMGPKGGGTSEFAPGAAAQAVGKLPPDQIIADLETIADYARKIPAANGKIAVAGFGWGAEQALRFAAARSEVSALYLFNAAGGAAKGSARIFNFSGPEGFMRVGDAPGAWGPAKNARDEAWERWKKVLAEL